MKEKSPYKSFFGNTQDIQCITCLDAYVPEYYIRKGIQGRTAIL